MSGMVRVSAPSASSSSSLASLNTSQKVFWRGQWVDESTLVKELMGNESDDRNLLAVFLAILVIVFVLLSVVATAFLLSSDIEVDMGKKVVDVSNEDLSHFNWTINKHTFSLHNERERSRGEMDVDNGRIIKLMNHRGLRVRGAWLSPDNNHLLVHGSDADESKSSEDSIFLLIHMESGLMRSLGKAALDKEQGVSKALWIPHTSSALIFVHEARVFYVPQVPSDGVGPLRHVVPLGEEDAGVLEGVLPPLYREFIWRSEEALWPTSSGRHVAFMVSSDRAGQVCPDVSIRVVQLATKEGVMRRRRLRPPSCFDLHTSYYITFFKWKEEKKMDEDVALVGFVNNHLNVSTVAVCSPTNDWECTEVYNGERPILKSDLLLLGHDRVVIVVD